MANKIKLLLAEDEAALGQIIKESLETRILKSYSVKMETLLSKSIKPKHQKF